MRRQSLILLVACVGALFVLSVPASAQEVVYLKNGSTMAIESHTFEDGMVHVKLGGQSEMAFPLDQVERIERSGDAIPLPTGPANRVVSGSAVVSGEVPSHLRRGSWESPIASQRDARQSLDHNGVAVYRPFGADAPANRRQFAVTGRRDLSGPARSGSGGVVGTNQVGTRYVLPPKQGSGARPMMPVGLSAKAATGGQGSGNASGNTGDSGTSGDAGGGGGTDSAGGEND